jgi:hypothetical protein
MKLELDKQQRKTSKKLFYLLKNKKMAILSGETRSGKTLVFLEAASQLGVKTLVVTQKNAIKGIEAQSNSPHISVTNYSQVKNLPKNSNFGLIVLDECHRWIAKYPKTSTIWNNLKPYCKGVPIVFSSGTLTPETHATLFNMLKLSDYGPWISYPKFTMWFYGYSIWLNTKSGENRAFSLGLTPKMSHFEHVRDVTKSYGFPYKKYMGTRTVDAYDRVNSEMIMKDVEPYTVTMTTEGAGIKHKPVDKLISIPLTKTQERAVERIRKHKIDETKGIVCETPAAFIQKSHQISGGFVFTDDETIYRFKKNNKIEWIKKNIDPEKTFILAYYKEEQEELAKLFPHTGSITKLAEGGNLSMYETIVAYSIGFSAATYWQFRARQMNKTRETPITILFLMSGIDNYVYRAVSNKKNFTLAWYKKNA